MKEQQDRVSRIICERLNLRAYAVNSLRAVREITGIHGTTPNATIPLARTITAGALLAATLKPGSGQSVSLKFSGSGPLKEINVQADAGGNVRAYVARPEVDLEEHFDSINFSRAIGAGFLTVVKDLGLREPYTSHIPLLAGDVARDIAYYLTVSEQVPSALLLGLAWDSDGLLTASGGILIQTFPETPETSIALIEKNINSMHTPLGDMLLQGTDMHDIVSEIFNGEPLNILGTYPLHAACRCSREMLAGALLSLHEDDLNEMITEDSGAEITCTFCKKKHSFTGDDLRAIVEKKKSRLS
ncbi:MAG TPA: Hsp33 family molecular chaperone HslO [Spirochaetota bacterium]|nr:Hsp33 family molecular chaperone HslO [Spirochaetota bacterium]HPI90129.1 Hsp33 family molecular chaperone HslO [Spirochaetota bacterium]HPR49155.1 Hsp33 family molecular chaperone HslO [Spirochaetota bacterium]